MAKDTIADFLVRLGFDGKAVIKGVAQTEAALKRLKKAKIDSIRMPRDAQADQAVKATKQRIQAEQNLVRMREKQARKDEVQRKREIDHLNRVRRARAAVMRSRNMMDDSRLDPTRRGQLRGRLFQTRDLETIKNINAEIRESARTHADISKRMQRQLTLANALSFSWRGIADSLKNFARSWVSVFAVIGGSIAGLRFTQQFRALDASMLAVSENSESAAQNVEYIKQLATELPTDIQKAGDNFKNMLAAGRRSLGQEGVQELFTAVTEFGTALQVDPERMNRGVQALSQMLNKGQVMAEELKQQWIFCQAA